MGALTFGIYSEEILVLKLLKALHMKGYVSIIYYYFTWIETI